MAGPNTLEAPPMRTWAAITDQKVGTNAVSRAPTAKAMIPEATKALLGRSQSTRAPAGVWVRIPAMPPTMSAIPTFCSFQPYPAR